MDQTIEQALRRAAKAQKEGRIDEAKAFWLGILETEPLHPIANHNLGAVAVAERRLPDALSFLKIALEKKPSEEQFWLTYLGALIQARQHVKARELLNQAKIQGVSEKVFNLLNSQLRDQQESEVTSLRVSDGSPAQNELRKLLELYQSGELTEAEQRATAMTKKFPEHPFAWKVLGAVLEQKNELAEALYAHQVSAALAPNDADAHNNIGHTLTLMGKFAEAESSCKKAIAINPNSDKAYNNLGNALHEQGRFNDAVLSFEKAVTLNSQSAVALVNLSNTLLKLGRLEEAEEKCQIASQLSPDNSAVYFCLGAIFEARKNYEKAKTYYYHATALKPDYLDALLNLGNVHREMGELADAETICRKVVALRDDYAEGHNNLAVTLKDLGRLEDALESCRRAIDIKPGFAEAYSNLGAVLRALGMLGEAEETLVQAISLQPDSTEALTNLGITLQEQGRLEEAVASFQEAFSLRTGIQPVDDPILSPATISLFFELTNKCNFHCTFCPSDDQKRELGFMNLELVKQLYTEAAEKQINPVVNLHLMGEPTLHPDLIEILNFAASKKIKTNLTTNGSTLVAKNVPNILNSTYGTIIASHMTPTEDTYYFRGEVGLSWHRYIANIRLLVREYLKRIAAGTFCHNQIIIRVMVTQNTAANVIITDTPDEAALILKEWNEFVAGAEKELGMVPFNREDHTKSNLLPDNQRRLITYPLQKGIQLEFWRAFTFANTKVSEDYTLEIQEETAYCPKPFEDVAVLWNGDVTLCGLDHDGVLKVGNVKNSSIEHVIQNEAARTLRGSMLGRSPLPSVCKTCQAKPIRNFARSNSDI